MLLFKKKSKEIEECKEIDNEEIDIEEINTEKEESIHIKDFMDMITPSVMRFLPSSYVFGNTHRQVIAIRNYPVEENSMALLSSIGEMNNVTLKISIKRMDFNELNRSIDSAINKNSSDINDSKHKGKVEANSNIKSINSLITIIHEEKQSMFKVAVFIEMIERNKEDLRALYNSVVARLKSHKISYDNLYLQQQEGFLSVFPVGKNMFKEMQFDNNMPSMSVANLLPFSYSGAIDPQGIYIGKDNHGGHVIPDFDKRDNSHTNSNILILGNSGEGKTYLLNLITTNYRLKGKKIISLDPEEEKVDLTRNLGGTNMDLTDGKYIINVLEPKMFSDGEKTEDKELDNFLTFKNKAVLSQHISFLRDFFKTYKDLDDMLLDVLEIMITGLYEKFGINKETDLSIKKPKDFPILSDLYDYIEDKKVNYDDSKNEIYTKDMLRNLQLHLDSICAGSDSLFFNGHTNIETYDHVNFGVKRLLEVSKNLRNAVLFNVLSYMTGKLLIEGNTVAILDEFYLFLDNPTIVMYIRNYVKRVRKKDSGIILASQNIEDFLQKDIVEMTKPIFAIPTYKFLFYPGDIEREVYQSLLSLADNEYNLIRSPRRGNCLFVSGSDKYHIRVHAPEYKSKLYGSAGGR